MVFLVFHASITGDEHVRGLCSGASRFSELCIGQIGSSSCREHEVVLLSSISFVLNDLNPSTGQDRLGNAIERLERLERLSVLWCRSSTEEELTTQL